MAKATPLAELQDLHRLVAQSLNQRISLDIQDNIPNIPTKSSGKGASHSIGSPVTG